MGTQSLLDVPVTKLSILSDSQIYHIAMGAEAKRPVNTYKYANE